jgi:broad specificity phosphatase PhoE
MLIAVRHGETKFNGSDGKERSRGWLPIPLTPEGITGIAATAQKLARVKDDIKSVHTSDLVRAVQSAHEIGITLGKVIDPTEKLRDWNVGDYAGQEISKILPHTLRLIDNPDESAPGGESYNDYLDRAIPYLRKLVESPDVHVAINHNRTMTLLHALTKNGGEYPDTATLKTKGPVKPAGFMAISPEWKILHMEGKQDGSK